MNQPVFARWIDEQTGQRLEIQIKPDCHHWRWFCSCGRAGTRLCFRDDVVRLARMHQNRHEQGKYNGTK